MYREQTFKALFLGKRILIAGYGREGRSSHSFIQKLLPDLDIDIAQNDEEIYAALARNQYDMIIKSPGISTMKFEGRCDLSAVTSQVDLFLQVYGDCTVAVTGTKGKSTTTSLLYHVLKEAGRPNLSPILAGNIGIPLFDIIPLLDENSIVTAEFSCHQLENIRKGPHVGIILNLYQEHLDHYHDYMGYKMAKMQMALRQQSGDYCFYCTDNEDLDTLARQLRPSIVSQMLPYGIAQVEASKVSSFQSNLKGAHNLSNIYVVHEALALLGITDSEFEAALKTFNGLEHRLEFVGSFQGIAFYNDSISTIPAACQAAIEALKVVDTLILGGFDRGIDYEPLADYLVSPVSLGGKVGNLVFVGAAGRRIYGLCGNRLASSRQTLIEDDYSKIVPWCFAHTAKGRVCLLSPAAASYDAFKNFEERGSVFKSLVTGYKKTQP